MTMLWKEINYIAAEFESIIFWSLVNTFIFCKKMCEKKTVKPFKTKVNIYRFHFYNLNFCVKGLLTSERKELKESRKFGG